MWEKTAKKASALPAETRAGSSDDLYAAQLRLTKVLSDAGVPLLAGSDVTGASWEIPGASLHQEFDELGAAGLSPLQVLQSTTSAAARFVGRDDFGAVATGKRADLVLLRDDPTASVSALHGVVGGGPQRSTYRLPESDLAGIKERIARDHTAG